MMMMMMMIPSPDSFSSESIAGANDLGSLR